jgi:hypothetical protein
MSAPTVLAKAVAMFRTHNRSVSVWIRSKNASTDKVTIDAELLVCAKTSTISAKVHVPTMNTLKTRYSKLGTVGFEMLQCQACYTLTHFEQLFIYAES